MAEGCFFGVVSAAGVLTLDQEAAYRAFVRRKFAGKAVEQIIRAKRSKRSLDQNAAWWGLIVPAIADDVGYDRHEHDAVHYALVAKCFGTHEDKLSGLQVPNVRSSKLTTKQFSELMEWAVRWAATELGVVILLPEEVPY